MSIADIIAAVRSLSGVGMRSSFFRACNLEDIRIGVEAQPLSPADKLILYRDLGYTNKPSDAEIIGRHIEDVFTRSLVGRSDRYTKDRHALYTSAKRAVAEAEMRYYARTYFFNASLQAEPMSFNVVELTFSGLGVHINNLYAKFPWLRARTALSETQAIGDCASDKVGCLIVRSVRARGDNGVLFRASEITRLRKRPDLNIMIYRRTTGRYTRLA